MAVSCRGGALASVATIHRSLDCSACTYAGSVTCTAAHLPSGLSTGAPRRLASQTSSCVIGRFVVADGPTTKMRISARVARIGVVYAGVAGRALMTIRTKGTAIGFASLAAAALSLTSTRGIAQQPPRPEVRQQSIGASTANLTELRAWDAFVDGSLRDGRLIRRSGYPDGTRPGRRVESFVQQYGGLEVYGGDVSRILDNNVTIAMSGKVYEDMAVDVVPRIGVTAASAAIEHAAGSPIHEFDPPQLLILP